MNETNSIHIGTSGWVYKHWQNIFYPDSLDEKERLKYYSQYFSTVEVNSSFYHLLKEDSINNWLNSTPKDFVFAIKASRYITHMKRLKDPEKTTVNFFKSIEPFQDKTESLPKSRLGPILFQLPPNFSFNPQRLKSFLTAIPKDYRYVFEFRDPSWFNPETYDILKEHNTAFCIYYLGEFYSPKEITADFVYIRLHGNYGLGSGKYKDEELKKIAQDIEFFKGQNKDVFCYFNNDEAGYAVQNASELKQQLNLSR